MQPFEAHIGCIPDLELGCGGGLGVEPSFNGVIGTRISVFWKHG